MEKPVNVPPLVIDSSDGSKKSTSLIESFTKMSRVVVRKDYKSKVVGSIKCFEAREACIALVCKKEKKKKKNRSNSVLLVVEIDWYLTFFLKG